MPQNDKVEFSRLLDADRLKKEPTADDDDDEGSHPEPSNTKEPQVDDYSFALIQPPFAPNFDCRILATE